MRYVQMERESERRRFSNVLLRHSGSTRGIETRDVSLAYLHSGFSVKLKIKMEAWPSFSLAKINLVLSARLTTLSFQLKKVI